MVIFKGDTTWYCNKWISFAFFEDSIKFVNLESELGKKIQHLNAVRIDTLNLERILDNDKVAQFEALLLKVIKYNEENKGNGWHDSSFFPMYYEKLLELKDIFYRVYTRPE